MELIFGISGLFIGGFFGAFAMAILSGRAYEKGQREGFNRGYDTGEKYGYYQAYLDQTTADEVVFTSNTDNEVD